MMLRRMASVRSSTAWRSAFGSRSIRPCGRHDAVAVKNLTLRVIDWNFGQWNDKSTWASDQIRLFSSAAAPAQREEPLPITADEAKEALVAQLRPLCSALYIENRESTTTEALLMHWQTQITTLQATTATRPELLNELQRAYEEGVAIALKQREFTFASQLTHQMKTLSIPLTPTIYQYQIRAVALEWVTRDPPLSLEDLRTLKLDSNWEHSLLELVRTENLPHHRKSTLEREFFHNHLFNGIRAVLAEYEAAVPLHEQVIGPYNVAVRVYASNSVPFSDMLRVLNQIPKNSPARASLTVDTFVSLLEGARWKEISNTVERLTKSSVLRKITDVNERSHVIARVWEQALRAVCNSFNERAMDKSVIPIQTVKSIQHVFGDVEMQLRSVLPEQRFANIEEHNAVFEVRVKTAALLGLRRQVKDLLDEYVATAPVEYASGQLSKGVFLKALEIFPSVGLKRVSFGDVERVRAHKDVTTSPEVAEVQQLLDDTIVKIADLKQMRQTIDINSDEGKKSGKALRKEHQNVVKLKKQLHDVTTSCAILVAHRHHVKEADRIVDNILSRLVPAGEDVSPMQDLEVAVALMNQFMTTANRFASRMTPQTREILAEDIMNRVFDLLNVAAGDGSDATPFVDGEDDHERALLTQLFALAAKTAAMFWREQDLEDVLRLKKKVLQTEKLSADDYERKVFLRVQKLDISGAYNILQEMHFAGVAPTPVTIHRVVTGALRRLYRPRTERSDRVATSDETEEQIDTSDNAKEQVDTSDNAEELSDAMEDEDSIAHVYSNGPRSLSDLPSFIQEWYNLHRVKPMAKTVVPVFARLLATNKIWEVKRFLQIMDSMDGGLSPVTEYWLERRLAAAGKTVADLRYTRKK